MHVQSTLAWRAKPRCSTRLVATLEGAVNALPPEWLLPPHTGEIFDSIDYCKRRLKGYALTEGFDVVQPTEVPRKYLALDSSTRSVGTKRGIGGSSSRVSSL
jgi:hypothetical protein